MTSETRCEAIENLLAPESLTLFHQCLNELTMGLKALPDKPDETARYKNLVDILDEMLITNVGRYAIVDLSDSEKELIKNTK